MIYETRRGEKSTTMPCFSEFPEMRSFAVKSRFTTGESFRFLMIKNQVRTLVSDHILRWDAETYLAWDKWDSWRTESAQNYYASARKKQRFWRLNSWALYEELDENIIFAQWDSIICGLRQDALGSYTKAGHHEKGPFPFSLLFVGYGVKNPLSRPYGSVQTWICPLYGSITSRFRENTMAAGASRKCLEILLFIGRRRTDTVL